MHKNVQDMADACLSLEYKYSDIVSCVRNQRPQLLQDPQLKALNLQLEVLNTMFKQRVVQLAGNQYD